MREHWESINGLHAGIPRSVLHSPLLHLSIKKKQTKKKKKAIILQAKQTRSCWVLFTWCWNPAGGHCVAGIVLHLVPLHFNLLPPIAAMQIAALWHVENEQGCSAHSSEAMLPVLRCVYPLVWTCSLSRFLASSLYSILALSVSL